MIVQRIALCAFAVLSLSACGGSQTCDEPQPYEAARPGPKIAAPEGLDDLQANQQTEIPAASRSNERVKGDPCLDYPPVLRRESEAGNGS